METGLSGTEAVGLAIEKCSSGGSAERSGMKTGQQRHRDKDKRRRRQEKIGRFGYHITDNITRKHGLSPTIPA